MTPKPSIHQQKVLLCVWWTTAGIVHYELLPSGQTITAEYTQPNWTEFRLFFTKNKRLWQTEKVLYSTRTTPDRKNHVGNSSTFTMGDSTSPSVFIRPCSKQLSPVFGPG